MASEKVEYYKDRFKNSVYSKFSGVDKKLKTAMQSILFQLELKKLLPQKIEALEMFGMHGLWHTMDYMPFIHSLDIFEINKKYHELSKKNLKKYNVNFYCEDSIKFVHDTDKRYNFIVADIPMSGPFYDADSLPLFFDDMVRIALPKSVIVFNLPCEKLPDFATVTELIHQKCKDRKVIDLFYMPKNRMMSYVVVALQ